MIKSMHKEQTNEKGLTLIEITIALALVGLLFVMVFTFNDFGAKIFKHSQKQSENQSDVRIPIELISKELRFANGVTLLTSVPVSHIDDEFYIESGQIFYFKGGTQTPIAGASGVNDFTFTVTKQNATMLQIKIGKVGTTEFDVTTEVETLNVDPSAGIGGTIGAPALGVRFTHNAAMSAGGPTFLYADSPADVVVPQYSTFMLPSTAVAHFSNGSTGYLPVHWSGIVDTTLVGETTVAGSVLSDTVHQKVTVTAATIASIGPLSGTVVRNGTFSMPSTATATLTDGTTGITVTIDNWSPATIDTSSVGIINSQGTVAGTTIKAQLSVTVTAAKLPTPNVAKSGNDVTVTGEPGATAVLTKANGTTVQEVLDASGHCTFTSVPGAKSVYLKKTDWLDSNSVNI